MPTLIFSKLYKTLDYWSRDMPNFDFLEKGLGRGSPPHSGYDFSSKMFLIYILLTDQILLYGCLTSWDIGQYVYCNCFFQTVFIHDKNSVILRMERTFKVE